MARRRGDLPQLALGEIFLSDGGLESILALREGLDLPGLGAFALLGDETGRSVLRRYYDLYLAVASEFGLGFVLESPTRRASLDWAEATRCTPEDLDAANRAAIALLLEIRERWDGHRMPAVISGCVGPRRDPARALDPGDARRYHARQIGVLAASGADLVTGITISEPGEAIGIADAAAHQDLPAVISFTVETDGRLPGGGDLGGAIARVDRDAGTPPAYYMVDCAHPTHFASALDPSQDWAARVRGLRPNASPHGHAELLASAHLHEGDPRELARQMAALRDVLPRLAVFGGCCGTDHRHVRAIAEALVRG